ncbi:hypothetical protein SNE40_021176 [Patella caerulea]
MLDRNNIHVPILCIAHRVCPLCIEKQINEPCDACGAKNPEREYIFYGNECLPQFCQWIIHTEVVQDHFGKNKTLMANRHSRFIAHNSQAFDGLFVLRYFVTHTRLQPKIIANGSKILCISLLDGIRFLDSLAFMPMKLSQFSKTFDLPISKGIFPYMFLKPEHLDYDGVLPDLDFYETSSMSPTDREKVLKWYNKRREDNNHFNTKREIIEYCRDDVNLLRGGCGKFRKLFLELTQISPFQKSVTIASLCSLVYRRKFLPPFTIAVEPQGQYTIHRRYSNAGIRYMQYLEYTENRHIQHARNGGEKIVFNMSVDGWYIDNDDNVEVCAEFLGCVFHGCLCIKNRDQKSPYNNKTMGELYEEHVARMRRLAGSNRRIRCIWECEFRRLTETPAYLDFAQHVPPLVQPLQVRDAFYGGRTNLLKFYHKARKNERIRYLDFTSLYPYVNKISKYPVAHPEIILQGFLPLENYVGFVKCSILPPQNLYIPVLPFRANGKLMFPLCGKCVMEQNKSICTHEATERELSGTWVIFEVTTAIQKGYRLIEIFEVWHYPHTRQYDPNASVIEPEDYDIHVDTINDKYEDIPQATVFEQLPPKDLFGDYINMFLKIKQESSGYPHDLTPTCLECKNV